MIQFGNIALFFLLLGSVHSNFTNLKEWTKVLTYDDFRYEGPPRLVFSDNGYVPDVYQLSQAFKTGDPSITNLVEFNENKQVCFQFWYHVNVPQDFGLKLVHYVNRLKADAVLWARYGYNGDIWRQSSVLVDVRTGDRLNFVATTVTGTISIANVTFDPTMNACKFERLNTNFEEDIENGWYGNVVAAEDMKKFKNLRDHTSNSRKGKVSYLYNGKMGMKKVIKPFAKCFTFWFLRPIVEGGIKPTSFSLFLNNKRVFSSYDERHYPGEWIRAQIPLQLPRSDDNEMHFHTQEDTSVLRPGVFFDDFEFSTEPCSKQIDCNFEKSTCAWTNNITSPYAHTWTLGSGRAQNYSVFGIFPTPIYRKANLFSDFSLNRPENGIEIMSEFIENPNQKCATIKILHNEFEADDEFILYHIIQASTWSDRTELWRLNSTENSVDQSGAPSTSKYKSKEFHVDIPKNIRQRRLSFFARSKTPTTKFAILDIKLRDGKCSSQPTDQPTEAPKLEKETLIVIDELMKNSKANFARIIQLIKFQDPIKEFSERILEKISFAMRDVEKLLKE